jgi:hypothetical protein
MALTSIKPVRSELPPKATKASIYSESLDFGSVALLLSWVTF